MTSSLKLLSSIDKETKHSVNGWIREMERKLQLRNIPQMINAICVLYLRKDEWFHKKLKSKSVKLALQDRCIIKTKNGWDNNSYGGIQLQSVDDNDTKHIYRWDFKIKECDAAYGIIIGISSTRVVTKDFADQNSAYHYVYWSDGLVYDNSNDAFREIDTQFGRNDKVSMCLDLQNESLYFMVNDRKIKDAAYKDVMIDKKIKYRMFVSLHTKGDSVEIVNFKFDRD